MAISNALRLFLLIITDAGGEGKTFITLLFLALFELLGEDELTLDTDPGNRAASSIGGRVKFIDPLADPDESRRRIKEKLGPNTSLLIDAGANMQAASRQFEDMCRDLGHDLRDDFYDVRALRIVSTNKLAAAESAIRAAKRMDPPFPPVFVFNDRDGSGVIPDGITPEIKVGHLQPGLVSLVNEAGGFARVIIDGVPGFQHSADMIASYVWRFADQPKVRSLFGDSRIDRLRSMLDRETQNVFPFNLKQPREDAWIEHFARKAEILRYIDPFLDDPEAIIAALQRYKRG